MEDRFCLMLKGKKDNQNSIENFDCPFIMI